jgi:hypothetical protein
MNLLLTRTSSLGWVALLGTTPRHRLTRVHAVPLYFFKEDGSAKEEVPNETIELVGPCVVSGMSGTDHDGRGVGSFPSLH